MTLLRISKVMEKENYFFIFAGELYKESFNKLEQEEIELFLKSSPDNCYFFLRRIENESTFNSFIQISDILFASYINFYHSSNIISKAAFFKKPIIVSKGFCMERRVKKYQLGTAIEQENVKQAIDEIKRLEHFQFNEELIKEFKNIFSFDNFKQSISIATEI